VERITSRLTISLDGLGAMVATTGDGFISRKPP
jgi:hypothetical protein